MSEGKRPGGLTALAVLNFVFGGFGVLALLALVALMAFIGVMADSGEEGQEAAREVAKAWEEAGLGVFYAMIAVSAISTILQIASGVGYLKQKKFLGRTLGNAYAVTAVIGSLIPALMLASPEVGGGFQIGTLVGLIYPILTLILLNTTFKHDFIN
ncbi:MAG: hypothetical protein NXI31_23440 [bacterium]|nr:hypothetical protein [bacterium]